MTASELRAQIFKILDQVIETGVPVEIERKGRIVRLVVDSPPSKLSKLMRRDDFIKGDAGDLVHVDWSSEWQP
jgi:prevent-host-death family protein